MKKKVEFILNELIKNYLKLKQPISSTSLKNLANLNISPSTIRGYFQALEKMGMVQKEHFASGSYPSLKAMGEFWKNNFPKNINFSSLEELEKKCKELDILAFVKVFENQLLKEVYNVENKFIILEFENDESVIKYDENVFHLLKSLRYLHAKDIIKILSHYNIAKLVKKIKNFQKEYTINQNLLYNKFSNLNLEFLNEVDDLYINYNEKFLIKKYKLFNNDNEIEIYLIGDIYSNFLELFESMKGGENE